MSWLPEPIFDRWMAELRGGMYVQGQHCLRRKGKDCCLGVLLDIIDPTQWTTWAYNDRMGWRSERSVLPWKELQLYGIVGSERADVGIVVHYGTPYNYTSLAMLNDNYGLSYQQIAAVCCYYSDQIIKKETT